MHRNIKRKVIVLGITMLSAIIVGFIVNLANFSEPVVYIIGGVVITLLVLFGAPYAFGFNLTLGDVFSQDRKVVEAKTPDKLAVEESRAPEEKNVKRRRKPRHNNESRQN